MSELGLFATALVRRWSEIESALLSAADFPSFAHYLDSYRGLPLDPPPPEEQSEAQAAVGEALFEVLATAFVEGAGQYAESSAVAGVEEMAEAFEGACNLALFLWHGRGDRNFQFRTVVHFCALEGLGDALPTGTPTHALSLSFSEHGIRVGAEGARHFPRREPLSSALLTPKPTWSALAVPGPEEWLISRLRSVQREVCHLIDDWEHENALLAVEHTRIRQGLQKASPASVDSALSEILGRMSALRDALSVWVLRSVTDFQKFLTDVERESSDPDVLADADATAALLLAAVQKVSLPASVSRHRYHCDTFSQMRRWCEARLELRQNDLSTRLLSCALDVANGSPSTWGVLEQAFDARSYEWSLDFDPTPGLKACCWKLESGTHLFLSAFAFLMFARKLNPSPLGSHWMSTVASLVQMPETYPALPSSPAAAPCQFGPSRSFIHKVRKEALAVLERQILPAAEDECVRYLRTAFSLMEESK